LPRSALLTSIQTTNMGNAFRSGGRRRQGDIAANISKIVLALNRPAVVNYVVMGQKP